MLEYYCRVSSLGGFHGGKNFSKHLRDDKSDCYCRLYMADIPSRYLGLSCPINQEPEHKLRFFYCLRLNHRCNDRYKDGFTSDCYVFWTSRHSCWRGGRKGGLLERDTTSLLFSKPRGGYKFRGWGRATPPTPRTYRGPPQSA